MYRIFQEAITNTLRHSKADRAQISLKLCYSGFTITKTVTGYWGPKLRSSGELLNSGDLVSTEKIIKLFVDYEGNNQFPIIL